MSGEKVDTLHSRVIYTWLFDDGAEALSESHVHACTHRTLQGSSGTRARHISPLFTLSPFDDNLTSVNLLYSTLWRTWAC